MRPRFALSAFVLFVAALGALAASCGGAAKEATGPGSTGCPAGMVEVAPRGGSGKPFCLDRTEVTLSVYLDCVGKALCSSQGEGRECARDILPMQQNPVNCVDAAQAETYCGAQGKRLPTSDEWEWAARGGKAGPKDPGAGTCWSGSAPLRSACSVDRRGAEENALGLVDMAANVAEWTSGGSDDARTVRGGAYTSVAPADLHPEARRTLAGSTRSSAVGFRCAKSL